MKRRGWLFATILCCAAPCSFASDPPPPNLTDRVDYAAWMDAQFLRDGENAVDHYGKARDGFKNDPDAADLINLPAHGWTTEQQNQLAAWVDRNAEMLRHLEQGSRLPYCYFKSRPKPDTPLRVAYPRVQVIYSYANVAATRARLALLRGDAEAALRDALTILRVGRHIESQPSLQLYTTGRSISILGCTLLREAPEIGPAMDAKAWLAALSEVDAPAGDLSVQYAAEHAFFYDMVQLGGRDVDGDGRLEAIQMGPQAVAEFSPPLDVPRILSEFHAVMKDVSARGRVDYHTARTIATVGQDRIDRLNPPGLQILLPNLWEFDLMRREREAHRRGALLSLRLRAFHAEHKRWPEHLREALGDADPSIAQDPLSTGEFVYRVHDGAPLLYSLGRNGEDDRGERSRSRQSEAGDWVYVPAFAP